MIAGTNGTTDVKVDGACATNGSGTMTCTGFVGPITGNVTGNASGSAASITTINPIATGGTNASDANTALANLGAQAKLGTNYNSVTKTGSGNEVPGMTTTTPTAGDYVSYDGAKFVNTEPGIATDPRTTTTETIAATTKGKLVTFSNVAAVAASIAQCGTGSFDSLWNAYLLNLNSGTVTLTPTTSTINGAAALALLSGQGATITCDGANYHAGIDNAPPAVVITTSTPIAVTTTVASGFYNNQHATAGTAITYNLPTAAAGKQFCIRNSYNGSAVNTGVLTVNTSASGQFIIDVDGTLGATGGHITSGGAGGDSMCVVGVDATHWQVYVQKGTWTKS